MIKRILPIALLGVTILSFSACNNSGFKTKDGLEYKIVRDSAGRKAAIGDIIELNVKIKIGDSVLGDSKKMLGGKPYETQVQAGQFKADWLNGLTLLSAGDSAVFRVPVDSILKTVPKEQMGQLPSFMKKGKKLVYEVSLISVRTPAEYKQAAEAKAGQQKQVDDKILQDYFAKNNLKPQKTASGLYYIIQSEGTGATPQKGQTVMINYTGRTLDGKAFDSNTDSTFHHMEPLPIAIGQGKVIPGMEEGILLLKKGGKATIYIPSPLAYGDRGQGSITPNSILIFDILVTDIK